MRNWSPSQQAVVRRCAGDTSERYAGTTSALEIPLDMVDHVVPDEAEIEPYQCEMNT
jgi:hypothetical protein